LTVGVPAAPQSSGEAQQGRAASLQQEAATDPAAFDETGLPTRLVIKFTINRPGTRWKYWASDSITVGFFIPEWIPKPALFIRSSPQTVVC
jgi:hypothetical protein